MDNRNQNIVNQIIKRGDYVNFIDGREYVLEADRFNPDDSIDGFVGWFKDAEYDSYFGETPLDVIKQLRIEHESTN